MMRVTTVVLVAFFACGANSATLSKNDESSNISLEKNTEDNGDITQNAVKLVSTEDIQELPVITSKIKSEDNLEKSHDAVKLADTENVQNILDVNSEKISEDNIEIIQDAVRLADIEKNEELPAVLKIIQNTENDVIPLAEEKPKENKNNPSEDKVKILNTPENYIEQEIQIPVEIIEEPVQILRIRIDKPANSISNEIQAQRPTSEFSDDALAVKLKKEDKPSIVSAKPEKPSVISAKPEKPSIVSVKPEKPPTTPTKPEKPSVQVKPEKPSVVPAKPVEQNRPPLFTNPFAQGIQNLQQFFQQGIQNVNQAIAHVINPVPQTYVQSDTAAITENPNIFVSGIQNLQNGVQQGLQNINQTVQSIFNPPPLPPVAQVQSNDPDPAPAPAPLNPIQQGFVNINNGFQNGLQTLQHNFQSGLNNLTQSVQSFINPQSSPPAVSVQSDSPDNQPQQNNIFVQAILNLQQGFQQGVQNINQTFQNLVNPPPQILNDEGQPLDAGATIQQGIQTVGQGIQQGFQQIGQSIQNFVSAPLESIQRPIQQGIQTVQQGVQQGVQSINQNIQNIIRPQSLVAVNAAIDPVTATMAPEKIEEPEVVDEHDPVEKDEVPYQGPPELPTEETINNQENLVVGTFKQEESGRGGHLTPTFYHSNGGTSD